MRKISQIRTLISSATILLCMVSCANKDDKVIVIGDITASNISETEVPKTLSVAKKKKANIDTLSIDSLALDSMAYDSLLHQDLEFGKNIACYNWGGEYIASSQIKSDIDNSEYEINILITLLNSPSSDYIGGLVLYVDEENFVEAVIKGKAEGNHITLYYEEDNQNTTGDLFKDGDKLVTFELSSGEYVASWYKAMHRFVNESTVISIH